MIFLSRSAVVIVDHCDARLALEHGAKLGPAWQCANKTEVTPASQCSNIFNSCHTLLDLTGPLQLGALPGKIFFVFTIFCVSEQNNLMLSRKIL